uniref:Sm domain-containing protein n=1 Tax=Meloidogyne enterolobii TaxID=390850 RepID=A0A6V7UDP0_MELEN|nr:unnamed protein product [Meloidogyne enterolobii]
MAFLCEFKNLINKKFFFSDFSLKFKVKMVDTNNNNNSQLDQEESLTTSASLPDTKFVTNKERQIYGWIDQILRIELIDGRVYQGILLCVDNQSNIILGDSREYWIKSVKKDKISQSPSAQNNLESNESSLKTKKQKKRNKKGGKQKEEVEEVETNFGRKKELSPMRKVFKYFLGLFLGIILGIQ